MTKRIPGRKRKPANKVGVARVEGVAKAVNIHHPFVPAYQTKTQLITLANLSILARNISLELKLRKSEFIVMLFKF